MKDKNGNDVTSASLAENSVVIAFRDWQWQNNRAHTFNFSSFVSLAGKAEAKLGDGIVGIGDRLFLLEVKSTRNNINSEWETGKKKATQKKCISSITESIKNPESRFNKKPNPRNTFVFRSLRGRAPFSLLASSFGREMPKWSLSG